MTTLFTILILENSLSRRYMYQQAFDADYTLLFADTPREALSIFARQRPDLVVLNTHLPAGAAEGSGTRQRLDGIDLCRMIKRSPLRATPVILRANREGILDGLRARRAGADRYLPMPVATEALREAVGELLSPKIIAARLHSRDFLWSYERPREQARAAYAYVSRR